MCRYHRRDHAYCATSRMARARTSGDRRWTPRRGTARAARERSRRLPDHRDTAQPAHRPRCGFAVRRRAAGGARRCPRAPASGRRHRTGARHRRLHRVHVLAVRPRAGLRRPGGQQRATIPARALPLRGRLDDCVGGLERHRRRGAAGVATARPRGRARGAADPGRPGLRALPPIACRLDERRTRGRGVPRRPRLFLGDRAPRPRRLPAADGRDLRRARPREAVGAEGALHRRRLVRARRPRRRRHGDHDVRERRPERLGRQCALHDHARARVRRPRGGHLSRRSCPAEPGLPAQGRQC